jgi:hypothetical protein
MVTIQQNIEGYCHLVVVVRATVEVVVGWAVVVTASVVVYVVSSDTVIS